MKLGRWEAAVADYNSALRLQPRLASALFGRGVVRLKQGDAVNGKTDMSAAERLRPGIAAEFKRYGADVN